MRVDLLQGDAAPRLLSPIEDQAWAFVVINKDSGEGFHILSIYIYFSILVQGSMVEKLVL